MKKKHSTKLDPLRTATTALGQSIRNERKARALSQQELAIMAGVGINFVSQVEAGKSTAHIGKVISVLKALGLELRINRAKQGDALK